MSYRRKRENAAEARRYAAFCREQEDLIAQIALPSFVAEDHENFLYLLEHAALWPHAPVEFNVDDLQGERRKAWLLLLDRYVAAGFGGPSLIGLSEGEMKTLERKHPAAFAWRHPMGEE